MKRLSIISYHTSPLVQPGTGDGGGMNVYVRQLSSSLARLGLECNVYTRAYSTEVPASVTVEPGFTVHHVPAGPISEVSKEELYDHVSEFTSNLHERMLMKPKELPELIHANYWLSGITGHYLKHAFDIPLVTTFHTLERIKARDRAEPDDGISEALRMDAELKIINCSDAVLASCEVEAREVAELYGLETSRLPIVPLGVDHAFFSPGDRDMARAATGLPKNGKMVLYVGRIQPLKGADIAGQAFVHVARRVADAFLVMVGGPSGPFGMDEIAKVRQLFQSEGLGDRVHFVEPQRHEILSSFYRAADVSLVPSRTESFGLVALEAAACGLPVVASNVGGLKTLVKHGLSGYLVETRSAEEFGRYVTKVLENPSLANSLKREAATLSSRYRWKDSALDLCGIFNELTSRELVECG